MHELHEAMSQYQHLQHLIEYIIQGRTENKNQLPQAFKTYWAFRDDMAVIDQRRVNSNTRSITTAGTKTATY